MTSLVARPRYTDEELHKLYPPGLELQMVQVLMRHGERTPVSARFQNAGLPGFWPYCASVQQFRSAVLQDSGGDGADHADGLGTFTTLAWRRRLETFGPHDEPVVAKGPQGELDSICDLGSLTDRGRSSTYKLGMRLRELYIDRLKFIPATITSTKFLYLRSTPVPRALESLQQTYSALYPPSSRRPDGSGDMPVPTIFTRASADETLFPNDSNCHRFAALSRAFAQRTADRWNATAELEYLNKLYGKWMPLDSRVAVDSHPRLSGIMDTINSTDAHGPATKLPTEFYDTKGRRIVEKIGVEEWYSGYAESRDYRMLGIGGLLGDIVGRMVGSAESSAADGHCEVGHGAGRDQTPIKFGLSGCHDTTLAAVLTSLGAFNQSSWPPFTSHVAIELFRTSGWPALLHQPPLTTMPVKRSWWGGIRKPTTPAGTPPSAIGRKSVTDLTSAEESKLAGYYVRMRYNDEPVTVPACRLPGNHLEGDETFCTLTAFKAVVDKFTPTNWRQQCRDNMELPVSLPDPPEWAGY